MAGHLMSAVTTRNSKAQLQKNLIMLLGEKPRELQARLKRLRDRKVILLGRGFARKAHERFKEAGIMNIWLQDFTKLDKKFIAANRSALFVYGHMHEKPTFDQVAHTLQGSKAVLICFQQLYSLYPDVFLPYCYVTAPSELLKHRGDLLRVFSLLNDRKSRQTFIEHLMVRLLRIPMIDSRLIVKDTYFSDGIVAHDQDAIFYDCGAFDGDSVFNFIAHCGQKFKRIVAFEPDPGNFSRLRETVAAWPHKLSKKIKLVNRALADWAGKAGFSTDGLASSRMDESAMGSVITTTLDEFALNEKPTFIKFDIEGAERLALLGARKLLGKVKPALAVCVYHRPEDLWQLPLLIKSFNPGYRFYLRASNGYGDELVIYAVNFCG
ncbi:MAG: FkbM family methyltransferase [Deltaproteobacteria bacterium]|nr:FkbM family methyltransferase [Deltaproteobacteria bacterium]